MQQHVLIRAVVETYAAVIGEPNKWHWGTPTGTLVGPKFAIEDRGESFVYHFAETLDPLPARPNQMKRTIEING